MKKIHLEKKGIRCLAISESFRKDSKKSILVGVVMRKDFLVDGFVIGTSSLEGDDATEQIIKMVEKINRPDINCLLISGIVISLYNIIDLKKISSEIQIPVIAVTYEESDGIEDSIKRHFKNNFKSKLAQYKKLDKRKTLELDTGYSIFIRHEGCSFDEASSMLNSFTISGSIPEPIRVGKLLARVLLD